MGCVVSSPQIGLITFAQLKDVKDLGSGQFSIAKAATITVDGVDRQTAVKILKSSEKVSGKITKSR